MPALSVKLADDGSSLNGGRYEIRGQIGEGGQAVVLDAWDQLLARDVAIKIFKPSFFAGYSAQAQAEIKFVKAVAHPNVTPIYDDFEVPFVTMGTEQGPSWAYVMPRADESLADARARGADPDELQRAVLEALDGVVYLHRQRSPIAHGDICPSNCLRFRNRWQLADFGVALEMKDRTSVTAFGGRRRYAAPEVLTYNLLGPKADVFSIAYMLHEVLTGRTPRDARPTHVSSRLSEPLRDLITECTHEDRDERPSAEEFRRRLRRLLIVGDPATSPRRVTAGSPLDAPTLVPDAPARIRRRRTARGVLWVLAAVVAVAAGAYSVSTETDLFHNHRPSAGSTGGETAGSTPPTGAGTTGGTASGVTTAQQPLAPPDGNGYWLVASDGGVFTYGDAQFYGSAVGKTSATVVGMAPTSEGHGYWLAAWDGGVFAYGDARFYGSAVGKSASPIVGIAATPDGRGYWLVASDGGVFTFGDAQFYGSMGGQTLNAPVTGMAATSNGAGYWLVASDGGVFAFGNAQSFGSLGGQSLAESIVGITPSQDDEGYYLIGSLGGINNYGDASYFGDPEGATPPINGWVVSLVPDEGGDGYWMAASDGGVFAYGNANFYGSQGNAPSNAPIVGMAPESPNEL